MIRPATLTLPPGVFAGLTGSARVPRWQPGLDTGCRHAEIFAEADTANGAGLALALARDSLRAGDDGRPWLWVQDKAARRLSGWPYRPGLPRDLRHRLIHVAADRAEEALFALEEGLRCRDLAFVIGEIAGNPAVLDFTASRRLSLAAEKHGVPLWLVRLGARHDLGSARMRWDVAASPGLSSDANPMAPGAPRWRASLFRAHTFQPGEWIIGDDGHALSVQPAIGQPATGQPEHTPDHGDLVRQSGDRSLASGQRRA